VAKSKETKQAPKQAPREVVEVEPESLVEQESSILASISGCGGALRLARENQKISVNDIATSLRLSVKQIEAIESDNFANLPEPTIVRGFIRNYAKQLKIAAEPLLAVYSEMMPSTQPHEMIVKPSANMKMTSYQKPKTGLYALGAVVLLLLVGIWLFYQNYVQKPSPTKQIADVGSVEPLSLPEPALPAAERAATLQPSTELSLPPAQGDAAIAAPADSALPATAPPTIVAPVANAEIASTAPVAVTTAVENVAPNAPPAISSAAGMGRLEFSATQETWVNVVDASGKEVYSKTIFAGSRESMSVTLPANVTVGNAGATSLNMNGKSFDLAPYSRNNVAHIKLEK
jgi:cytoskeleton protein RodZ